MSLKKKLISTMFLLALFLSFTVASYATESINGNVEPSVDCYLYDSKTTGYCDSQNNYHWTTTDYYRCSDGSTWTHTYSGIEYGICPY